MTDSEYRLCPHGYHHAPWVHSCDGCWCEGERDRREYGWPHDTSPREEPHAPRPYPARELEQSIHRLRKWTEADYHREGRDWLHLRDLNTVIEAAEQHLEETTP